MFLCEISEVSFTIITGLNLLPIWFWSAQFEKAVRAGVGKLPCGSKTAWKSHQCRNPEISEFIFKKDPLSHFLTPNNSVQVQRKRFQGAKVIRELYCQGAVASSAPIWWPSCWTWLLVTDSRSSISWNQAWHNPPSAPPPRPAYVYMCYWGQRWTDIIWSWSLLLKQNRRSVWNKHSFERIAVGSSGIAHPPSSCYCPVRLATNAKHSYIWAGHLSNVNGHGPPTRFCIQFHFYITHPHGNWKLCWRSHLQGGRWILIDVKWMCSFHIQCMFVSSGGVILPF